MKQKGILHLNYEDKSRNLNYVINDEGKVVVITSGKSNKIAYMKTHDEVELVIDNEVVKAKPNIIEDKEVVKNNFEFMTQHDNNHFKAYNDIFVSVEFRI